MYQIKSLQFARALYEYVSPVSIVMDQAGVDPLLLDDELNLVVQARLVRRGEGEEGHADVDLREGWKWREGEKRKARVVYIYRNFRGLQEDKQRGG